MVRRKAATGVTVYRDELDPLNSDDHDDDASHHLPPRKKPRLGKEPPVAATVPRTRRAALKEKATNPSSSDNSFLQQHELFHEKPQGVKKKTSPDSKTAKAPSLGRYLVGYFWYKADSSETIQEQKVYLHCRRGPSLGVWHTEH